VGRPGVGVRGRGMMRFFESRAQGYRVCGRGDGWTRIPSPWGTLRGLTRPLEDPALPGRSWCPVKAVVVIGWCRLQGPGTFLVIDGVPEGVRHGRGLEAGGCVSRPGVGGGGQGHARPLGKSGTWTRDLREVDK